MSDVRSESESSEDQPKGTVCIPEELKFNASERLDTDSSRYAPVPIRFQSLMRLLFAPLALLIIAATMAGCDPAGIQPDWLPPAEQRLGEWEQWRVNKDSLFLTDASPIPEEQRPSFAGLNYFPFDSTLAFPLALEPVLSADTLRIPTTTGLVRHYVRYGRFTFQLAGRIQHLTAFRSIDATEGHHSVFIPFTDPTNRTATYGGGRYLDLYPVGQGKYVLDFNYAYSPYCAYDERWSCPIPPSENRLAHPVEAGERYPW